VIELDAGGLKARLQRRAPPAFSVYGDDGAGREEAALTAASVLVPVIMRAAGLTVLFTQRTTHLRAHSGQVSFPGGRAEPGDASAEFTALREAEEEVGLARERVEVVARLADYCTRTGFRVTPVVGLIAPPLELRPDPNEVQDVFEVPLGFLLDPANHARESRQLPGGSASFYVIQHGERRIWGATAGMIVNLYRQLAAAGAPPAG
jgi:8-oxo-dGTP pyrophosphatase MutT (NUDIX family)